MDSLTVEQYREQVLFDRIEMDPIDRLAELIKRLCAVMGTGTVDDYEPEEWRKDTEEILTTPDQAVAMMQSQIHRGK